MGWLILSSDCAAMNPPCLTTASKTLRARKSDPEIFIISPSRQLAYPIVFVACSGIA
ncbi:MAG: hypothetical protein OXC26_00465 [Albidovulum sp.]|nr:hypothetical protein [Albidovulum sp.]